MTPNPASPILFAIAALSATTATAQSSGWTGSYVGVDAGIVGGQHNQFDIGYDPGREPQYTYNEFPVRRTLSRAFDLDPAVSGAIRAGRLYDHGKLVWGGEVRLAVNQGHDDLVLGPISSGTLSTNFIPGLGSLNNSTDTFTAELKLGVTATAAARIGMPIGDKLLFSVFAGPSLAQADLSVRQDSVYLSQIATLCAGCAHFNFVNTETTSSSAGSESAILVGGVAGYIIEYKLSDHWVLHGIGSLARYSEMEASAGGANGGNSKFSVAPTLYSASVGVTYRF